MKITEIKIWEYEKIKKMLLWEGESQQVSWEDVISLPTATKVYDTIYNGSYIVAAIVRKIAKAMNTWWDVDEDSLQKRLEDFPVVYIAKCLIKYGNCYLEVIRKKNGEISKLIPIPTGTIARIKWGGYQQEVDAKFTYFNEFTPLEERSKKQKAWIGAWAPQKELKYNARLKTCGFNPNLNEVIHLADFETDNKRYGKSLFEPCIHQILLLRYIDDYYNTYFDNWCIRLSLFHIKNKREDEEITDEDRALFVDFIKEQAKGVKNAHKTILIENEIGKIELTDELDANQWIAYRRELQKSIAMAFEMPYDMIDSSDSNRSTSTSALESFYMYTIVPLQNILLKCVLMIVADDPRWSNKKIEKIAFNKMNTKNIKEESETVKNLITNRIITINEARKWMGYAPIDGGDVLIGGDQTNLTLGKEDIDTIKKTKALLQAEINDLSFSK